MCIHYEESVIIEGKKSSLLQVHRPCTTPSSSPFSLGCASSPLAICDDFHACTPTTLEEDVYFPVVHF